MDNSDMSFINPHRLTFSRQYLLSLIGVVTAICPSEVYFLKKRKKEAESLFSKRPQHYRCHQKVQDYLFYKILQSYSQLSEQQHGSVNIF